MKKDYLELGQIVGTHGVRGEVRVNPWCDTPEFARQFKTVYYDNKGEMPVKVLACRPHGNVILMRLEGINSLDDAAAKRNRVLYIRRDEVKLPAGTWFVEELLGCAVLDADDPAKRYGTLTDVFPTGANDVWTVKDDAGKEYLLPAIRDVVKKTDIENGRVYITPLKGIFEDAD